MVIFEIISNYTQCRWQNGSMRSCNNMGRGRGCAGNAMSDVNKLWVHVSRLGEGNLFELYPRLLREVMEAAKSSTNHGNYDLILPSDSAWRDRIYYKLVQKQRKINLWVTIFSYADACYGAVNMGRRFIVAVYEKYISYFFPPHKPSWHRKCYSRDLSSIF